MDPLQIVLIILGLAGVWAVIELALVLKSTRGTVENLTKTVSELNDTVNEARPMVAKIDGALDEVQPALAQVEPILKQVNSAVEALTADLVEVNGVLRDVSNVTGTVSGASNAVSDITGAAASKVQSLFGKKEKAPAADAPALTGGPGAEVPATADATDAVDAAPAGEDAPKHYYTYGGEDAAPKEDVDE